MSMNNNTHRGFTLIEAVVTIAVLGILLSIAIPSFSKMIERNRIASGTNEFRTALMLARSEAVTRSIPMTICVSDDGSSCNSTLKDYAKGWIIFSDCNKDGSIDTTVTTCDFDADGTNDKDTLINVNNGFKKLSIIAGVASQKDSFSYEFSGRPAGSNARFYIGPDASNKVNKLTIAITGRVKSCEVGTTGCS